MALSHRHLGEQEVLVTFNYGTKTTTNHPKVDAKDAESVSLPSVRHVPTRLRGQ